MQEKKAAFLTEKAVWNQLVSGDKEMIKQKVSALLNKTIIFIGDSITGDPRGNYCGYLAAHLSNYVDIRSIGFLNSGVESDTTVHVLDRLPDLLEETEPDLCVISLGVNDSKYLRKLDRTLIDPDIFEANLKAIICRIREDSDPSFILVTPTPVNYEAVMHDDFWKNHYYWKKETTFEYVQRIIKVASSMHAKVADAWAAFHGFDIEMLLYKDGVHPNQLGHLVLAATIFLQLAQAN